MHYKDKCLCIAPDYSFFLQKPRCTHNFPQISFPLMKLDWLLTHEALKTAFCSFSYFIPNLWDEREFRERDRACTADGALLLRHCSPPLGQHSPLSSTAAAFTPTAGLQHRSCIAQTQKTQLIIGDHWLQDIHRLYSHANTRVTDKNPHRITKTIYSWWPAYLINLVADAL